MGCGSSCKSLKVSDYVHNKRIVDKDSDFKSFIISNQEFIQDYIPIKALGSGSFSEVMLNFYKPQKNYRAVKIIQKSHLTVRQLDKSCKLKELAILNVLSHPNIIKSFGLFDDKYSYYLLTEYCEGGSLQKKLDSVKTFTEELAAEIVYQILNGLAHIHESNIIHRDIKLENVLLSYRDELSLKIADFGNSCFKSDTHGTKGVFGTCHYLAPEVFTGVYDEKIDIWSLGILLHILITGRLPYSGTSSAEVIKNVINCPFKVDKAKYPGKSKLFLDFIQSLLTLNPIERASAENALKHPWLLINRKQHEFNITFRQILESSSKCWLSKALSSFIIPSILALNDIELNTNLKKLILSEKCKRELKSAFDNEKIKKFASSIENDSCSKEDVCLNVKDFVQTVSEGNQKISVELVQCIFEWLDSNKDANIELSDIKRFCYSMEDENQSNENLIKEFEENHFMNFRRFGRLVDIVKAQD